MSEQVQITNARQRINKYTDALILAVSSFVFLSIVPFLPGAPVLSALLSVGIGIAALRRPLWAAGVLILVASLAITYQLFSFGLVAAAVTGPRGVLDFCLLLVVFVSVDALSALTHPTSVALGILAVALMLTPVYFLSIAVLAIAVGIVGLKALPTMLGSFVSTLVPFVVVENAFATSAGTVNSGTGPILFSQYSLVASHLAPSLQQLNVVSSAASAGVSASTSTILPTYLGSASSLELLIPTIVLSVILSSSVSVAGLLSSFIPKFERFERYGSIIKATVPLVAALGISLGFVLLVEVIAPATKFQAFLVTDAPAAGQPLVASDTGPIFLILGAAIMGMVFSAREFGIQRMERAEFARVELDSLLQQATALVAKATGIIQLIETGAPTVATTSEARQMKEHEAYLADIAAGMGQANYPSLSAWIVDMKERLLPPLERMPEALRDKLIDELSKFVSVSGAYDNMLEQAGLKTRFDLQPIDGSMDFSQAIQKYASVTNRIESTARELFAEYRSTTGAFNALMNRVLISPPVDPESLLQSKDYLASMRLVSEDYWLNFQQTYADDLRSRVDALSAELRELQEVIDPRTAQDIQNTIDALSNTRPYDSVDILRSLTDLISYLKENIATAEGEMKQLEKMVNALSSNASKMVHFEMLGVAAALDELENEVNGLHPNFDELSEYSKKLTQASRMLAEARKSDMRSIVILMHYGIAKDYIERQLLKKKSVPLADLPFTTEAALLYIRLLADSTRKIRYDEANEEVLAKNA